MFARRPGDGDGLVGSPLRNSSFGGFGTTAPSSTPIRPANGDLSPTVASPPRQASMSMLTQELQRTKLDAARSAASASASASAVGMQRTKSGGSTGGGRAVSGQSAVGRERIEEEQDLFDMDELGDPNRMASAPRPIPNGGISGERERRGSGEFGAIGQGRSTPK